ncbi:hypothetical protein TNCV_2091791 [Trichonephila clavipes]|nr:hypothetical protein TNCV_2091791 [Trichonephila clavipes]
MKSQSVKSGLLDCHWNLVYTTPLDSDEGFVTRISEAVACVREIPGIFERLLLLLHRRCQNSGVVVGVSPTMNSDQRFRSIPRDTSDYNSTSVKLYCSPAFLKLWGPPP